MINDDLLFETTVNALEKRGVNIEELGNIVLLMQKRHSPGLTNEIAIENIYGVLRKREVQHAILTGILLDEVSEKTPLGENPIVDLIKIDEGLYGVDETLALSITNCYGSIAASNFGYLDIVKPKIIGELDKRAKKNGQVHTFLDDIVSAVVAAACSRCAHNKQSER